MFTGVESFVTCGLATREHFVGLIDSPLSFVLPERANAQILWSSGGYVEYTFANTLPLNAAITAIDLAVEICSEAPGYANEYPSDVTLWVNGIDIGTWCSPGDLGGTRGRLNPAWWPDNMNQSGLLKVWHIDSDGSSVDGVRISSVKLVELGIHPWQPTRVRFGVKPGSPNQGGFTLFGKGFGNYEQDVVFRIRHVPTTTDVPPPLLHQPSAG
jgi:predicted transcriptional regulator